MILLQSSETPETGGEVIIYQEVQTWIRGNFPDGEKPGLAHRQNSRIRFEHVDTEKWTLHSDLSIQSYHNSKNICIG